MIFRHASSQKAGLATITADVRQGTRREAVLFSVGANASHGLRRTNEDKRRAVMTLLMDEEWKKFPLRKIARLCAVDEWLVRKVLAELSAVNPQIEKPSVREVERKGTTYTQQTANIGARPVEVRVSSEAPALDRDAVVKAANAVKRVATEALTALEKGDSQNVITAA